MHRIRRSGSRGNDRRLAHDAQYDRGCDLLRHVHRPRHGPHPVPGLLTPTVPGEGKALDDLWCLNEYIVIMGVFTFVMFGSIKTNFGVIALLVWFSSVD